MNARMVGDNMFIAEFGSKQDKIRVLGAKKMEDIFVGYFLAEDEKRHGEICCSLHYMSTS